MCFKKTTIQNEGNLLKSGRQRVVSSVSGKETNQNINVQRYVPEYDIETLRIQILYGKRHIEVSTMQLYGVEFNLNLTEKMKYKSAEAWGYIPYWDSKV